jgi:hypothetical protein
MYVMSLINDMRRRKAEGNIKKDKPYDEEHTQLLKYAPSSRLQQWRAGA